MATTGSTNARGSPAGGRGGGRWQRIAVLLEPGRSGVAAVERAVAIAREHEAELVLVALAPHAEPLRCSGPSAKSFNDAVCEAVAGELAAATQRIGRTGSPASSALLIDGSDPSLHRWVRDRAVDLVLLPARRPSWICRHPAARRLRRHSGAYVRVIAP